MARVKTEAKERAILDAAASVFARKPFHAVLIDEIASDAGIGKGTIYRYFETKDDLYFATTLHVLDSLAHVLSKTLPQEQSSARRLERIAIENLRFYWITGWGSTYGVIKEAVDVLSEQYSIGLLHFSELYPFPSPSPLGQNYISIMNNAQMTICIENNAKGQFARLMKAETGFSFHEKINKYDGRPFLAEELAGEISARIGRL